MTSASTLARRAAKTKNKAEAKRLREESAQLRRRERAKKSPRPASKIIKGLKQAIDHTKRINRAVAEGKHSGIVVGLDPMFMEVDEAANDAGRAASPDSMPLMPGAERPGRGEIVGGYLAHKADHIAKLARKKGGVDAIQAQLRMLEAEARHQGGADANARAMKGAQESNARWRENIVAGFMARMNALEQMHRGLPDTVIVDGVTLARVVDALSAAGYTARGKR